MKRLAQEYHMVDLVSYHVQVVSCHSLSEHGSYHWTHSLRAQDFRSYPCSERTWQNAGEDSWDSVRSMRCLTHVTCTHEFLIPTQSLVTCLLTKFSQVAYHFLWRVQPLTWFYVPPKCKNHQVIYNSLLVYHIQWQIFKTTHYYFLKRKYSKNLLLSSKKLIFRTWLIWIIFWFRVINAHVFFKGISETKT